MPLLSDIRRVFRSQARVRSISKQLSLIHDDLSLIGRALAVIVREQWQIDLYAPPVFTKPKPGDEGELMPHYTTDREQALAEAQAELDQTFDVLNGEPNELEKLLEDNY